MLGEGEDLRQGADEDDPWLAGFLPAGELGHGVCVNNGYFRETVFDQLFNKFDG